MNRRIFLTVVGIVSGGILGFFIGRESAPEPTRHKPLIGISSSSKDDLYNIAVHKSGGVPIVLPNDETSMNAIDQYLEMLDGLLIPGGRDIPPAEYGEEPHETVNALADERYNFEKALSKAWIEKSDKPLLGICLGSQWINVASGGSLIQDIPTAVGTNHRGVNHQITLEADSRLGRIFDGETQFEVNSNHHQAVNKLGNNLRIVAKSDDGVVEATETTDPNRFLIGVQWHPEKVFAEDARQRKLMKAFVDAATLVK